MLVAARLTDADSQPTLFSSHEPVAPPRSVAFSLLDLIAAVALLRATKESAPLSPSSQLTSTLVHRLERLGLIEVVGAAQLQSTRAVERALYDPIIFMWFAGSACDEFSETGLRRQIRAYMREPTVHEDVASVWRELGTAEIHNYLEFQLRKHALPTHWAHSAMALTEQWLGRLSISKLRYVVWASIRAAASTYLCTNYDLDATRGHLENSLRQRPVWLSSRSGPGEDFLPSPQQKTSLTLASFLRDVLPIGSAYWTALPNTVTVKQMV